MFFSDQQLDTPQCGKQQHGFVLILVLVLLAVLTLIGVSSMNSSTMELKATANARQHQVAFNAVQSVIEYALSSGATIDLQTTHTAIQVVDVSSVVADVEDASALSAEVNHAGCAIGVGSSMEEGKGFSYNFYNVKASGSNLKGTTTAIQHQGVRFPAAAC